MISYNAFTRASVCDRLCGLSVNRGRNFNHKLRKSTPTRVAIKTYLKNQAICYDEWWSFRQTSDNIRVQEVVTRNHKSFTQRLGCNLSLINSNVWKSVCCQLNTQDHLIQNLRNFEAENYADWYYILFYLLEALNDENVMWMKSFCSFLYGNQY